MAMGKNPSARWRLHLMAGITARIGGQFPMAGDNFGTFEIADLGPMRAVARLPV